MSLEYLTDEEIQAYLDGGLDAGEKKQIELKLTLSEENRQRLQQYQKLYSYLKKEPERSLSPGFIDKVMTAIDSGKKSAFSLYQEILIALTGLIVTLGVLSRVLNYRPVTNEFISIFNNNFALYSEKTWQFLNTAIDKLNGGLMIILFAALVLAVVKVADYFLLEPKYKRIWP